MVTLGKQLNKIGKHSLVEKNTLEPQWEGPFQVLLTSFTVVRIKEQNTWIHHTRLTKTPKTPWKVTQVQPGKLHFSRSYWYH
uniref:Murine leukemia virus integrase C-terminal domain-containing protein n=1 Tax=Cairina moschata TaxID=8855 RepID=A0A8C3C3E7_CAIMO